ncbi:alpha/beta fold hydrolase [Sandaracinus amylolyticus]|uniref:alpha/beta fold hydrolase n=1 Tax=Sandaracinus amylolyticus TaxID=927083 RepID=UPI001F43A898|nr:alpha/beta fold hydrolase [Sandaracinus amylolyticus]UJR85160.1 Hypothetical protein I5071_72400 [Sandaracinus amylolyticus]
MIEEHLCELPSGVRLCYRTSGSTRGEPLLLIAGLGLHLTWWPQSLIDGLVERGHHVIAFDNRDVGRSSRIATRPPGVLRQLLRVPHADNYDLGDMAEDTVGLLDHLGIDATHLVGMSMGGMIAQTIAARHPRRARSLVSIFSTTGARRVGQPSLSTLRHLAGPRARTRDQAIASHVTIMRHIGPSGFALDLEALEAYAGAAWDRGDGLHAPAGIARQIGAILKSGDRTRELRRITTPTLVLHGDSDLMVHPSGGRATARAIPGAAHVTIEGMGHHLPAGVIPRVTELVARHLADARQRAA